MATTITEVEVKNGVATVEFKDTTSGLAQTKSINVGDLEPANYANRYAEHKATFEHRLAIGLIRPPEPQLAPEMPDAPSTVTATPTKKK